MVADLLQLQLQATLTRSQPLAIVPPTRPHDNDGLRLAEVHLSLSGNSASK